MIRLPLTHHAALLALILLASACANGGGTRDSAATATAVQGDSAAADAMPTADATPIDSAPTLAASDAAATPATAGDGAPPPATQDFNPIDGAPYDPIADPTLPTPSLAPASYDPWEPLNRRVHAFNKAVDRAIAKPLAKAYVRVVPQPARSGVTNFFNNLGQPVTMVNALLQGKPQQAAQSLGRFALNTTVGLGGLFDPASRAKIPNRSEDFGQTLGVWGWKRSRYVELPLFGPRTVRDVFGLVGDAPLSPVRYVEDDSTRVFLQGLQLVDLRTQLFPLDNLLVGATDEYALIRDSWLQRRDFQISGGNGSRRDGEPSLPDYLREDDDNPSPPAGVMPIIPGSGGA
ncbi:MAG: MlaA family lipoprotein [Luteimonas sp.]